MRVLVTGATGFVGKYLIDKLVKSGYQVRCLVRETSDISSLKQYDKNDVDIVYGDITKPDSLIDIQNDIDYVIHLAAKGVVEAISGKAYEEFLLMNEKGTANLLDAFQGSTQLKRFVHFSSTAAMGTINQKVLNEETIPNPQTPYQKSKRRSEITVLDAFIKKKIPTVILRPCMIYGIGGKKGEYYKFCRLMKKGIFPKVGHGKNLTPMVYVTDVADAAILALESGKPGNIYIISDKKSYEMDEFRNCVVGNLGIDVHYPYVPKWIALVGAKILERLSVCIGKTPIVTYRNIKSTVTDRTFDITKAENELNYHPKIDMQTGTKMTVKWYMEEKML